MSSFWTEADRKEAKRRSVNILISNTTVLDLKPQLRELPSDTHLIKYELEGEIKYDAVRAHKRVDIFDIYYDRLKEMGGKVLHISVAGGYVKPKLWQPPKEETKS